MTSIQRTSVLGTRHAAIPWLAAVLAALCVAPVAAQPTASALYPHQRLVQVPTTETFVRVPLPEEVLGAAGPELERLRLVDGDGRLLPFVVAGGASFSEYERITEPVVPRDAEQNIVPGDVPVFDERYVVDVPARTSGERLESLRLDLLDAEFLARVVVTDARGRVLVEQSVFRLRDGSTQARIPLPDVDGPIEVRLRSNAHVLSPSFRFVMRLPGQPSSAIETELDCAIDAGVVCRLPGAYVASSLRITGLPDAARVKVELALADGSFAEIASTLVSAGDASRTLRLPVLVGGSLRITTTPPGLLPTVLARVESPELVFDASAADNPRLVYGGERDVPHALVEHAELRSATLDEHLPSLTLGPEERNPDFLPSPMFATEARRGAIVEPGRYRFEGRLLVERAPDRVAKVALPTAAIPFVRSEVEDFRIVDSAGRLVPFVVVGTERREVVIRQESHARDGSTSRYRFAVVPRALPLLGIRIDSPPSRGRTVLVRDRVERDGDELVDVASGTTAGERTSLDFLPHAFEELVIDVEDGDEAPLSLAVRGVVSAPELLVFAEPGTYRILFGAHGEDVHLRPRFEAEGRRELAVLVAVDRARISSLRPNPDAEPPSMMSKAVFADVALYALLALVSLGLFGLTFRLVREGRPADS